MADINTAARRRPAPSTAPKQQSRLSKVQKGVIKTGHRFCFYGVEAVGKSSLAAHAPACIFFDIEDGSSRLDVARYQFRDEPGGHVPRSLEEVVMAVRDLATHEHDYKTLVIDTVDRLEGLLWDHCLERDSGKKSELNKTGRRLDSIESYGFGKGYQVACDQWRSFINELERLRHAKQMDIILLGHATLRPFHNPDGEDWDRFSIRLQHSDRVSAAKLVMEWCDVVGFCRFEEGASKIDSSQRKAKGYSTGRRLVHFERTAVYDAKSRISLPEELVLEVEDPWRTFAEAVHVGEQLGPKELVDLINQKLDAIDADDEMRGKVQQAIASARGDIATLSRYLNRLRKYEREQQQLEEAEEADQSTNEEEGN